ncbi:MAG: PEP-CTERM sorting domain-containing protein [Opitutales bacterium]|nr:PEP-CTERM sorting domain-containing protein [Opitutales bacterium]
MKKYILPPVLLASLALAAHGQILTTYSDSFTGVIDERTVDGSGQVNSFAWYSRNNGHFQYDDGLLVGDNDRAGIGYFSDWASAPALTQIGDSISLSVDFQFRQFANDNGNDRLRIALLGSNGTPVTANWGSSHSVANGDTHTGFVTTLGPIRSTSGNISSANNIRLYGRVDEPSSMLIMGDNNALPSAFPFIATGGNIYSVPALDSSDTMNLTILIELTGFTVDAALVSVGVVYSHGSEVLSSMTQSDIETTTTQFDSIALYTRNPSVKFEEMALTHTVIPEPSTYAALFGLLALAFVWVRSRRK